MELRFTPSLASIEADAWDALAGNQPFVRHAFLLALEESGCLGEGSGWQPLHATLWQGTRLLAAMPLYLKAHSWGEYVFDWAWANASERAGWPYYPKLLAAIPFTPVPGLRLLAVDEVARQALLAGVLEWAEVQQLSGLHCLFPDALSAKCLQSQGLLRRTGVQFHWFNRGYADYPAFLASLNHDKRKKLKQERKRVAASGVQIVRKSGAALSPADWQFFYRCYANTYRQHRATPYLNERFFQHLGELFAEQCLLVIAYQDGEPLAAALNLFDSERLYGRYWGALQHVPNLHFELCYHQGIEFAIERGLLVFEGGAQGEHKLARGFEAVETSSWHWLAQMGLRDAVAHFLQQEGQGLAHYLSELDERAPFRQDESA